MPYVERINGKIVGRYALPQPGYAEEYLSEDSAELQPTASDIKDSIKAQITALEAEQYMTRGEREAWLALTVATAAAQGVNEATLYAVNPFYKHTKDLNTQIVALRAQL